MEREKIPRDDLVDVLLAEITRIIGKGANFLGDRITISRREGEPNWDAECGVTGARNQKAFSAARFEAQARFDIDWGTLKKHPVHDRTPLSAAVDDRGAQQCVLHRVKTAGGQAPAISILRTKPAGRSAANLLTRDEAWKMAVNFAKLPGLLRRRDQ
jgi:hypothetical protein